jgi:predicted ATPase/class 3 adenylate cyclase
MTDIVGSTRHWEQHPELMTVNLIRHDRLAHEIIPQYEGTIITNRGAGDSLFIVFTNAINAVYAAVALQIAYEKETWEGGITLHVRMGLHTGEANIISGNYYGQMVNFNMRLSSLGHGGQVVLSSTTYEAVKGYDFEGIALRNLGVYRQNEGHEMGNVYQAVHLELPSHLPRLRFVLPPENNLPAQSSRFIGRKEIVAQIRQQFHSNRLITLTGDEGIGKTRLALEVAQEELSAEGEGVWYVDLDQKETLSVILARAVGYPTTSVTLAELMRWMQAKNILLVWDHGARLAYLLEVFLKVVPQLRVLVCQKLPLGWEVEREIDIHALEVPPQESLLSAETLLQNESFALFVDRATRAMPTFTLNAQNMAPISALCRLVQGIPYAIELVAARFREAPLERIYSEIEKVPEILGTDSCYTLLQGVIGWSFDRLTSSEQVLLQRLSVFSGLWSVATAEIVCSDAIIELWEILDLHNSLADYGLLAYEVREGETYYRMHDAVRHFALPRLVESGEYETFQIAYITMQQKGRTQ